MKTNNALMVADIRAELARRRIAIFQIAAAVGVHPVRLGRMLNERVPLPPQVAQRLLEALR